MESIRNVDQWLEELRAHRDRLRMELRRVEGLLAAAKKSDAELSPTGGRRPASDSMLGLITQVFEDSPNQEFTAEQVWEAIKGQGPGSEATDPVNSVRGSLSRLKKRRIVDDVRRGVFRLHGDELAAADVQHGNDPWSSSGERVGDPWTTAAQGGVDDPPF